MFSLSSLWSLSSEVAMFSRSRRWLDFLLLSSFPFTWKLSFLPSLAAKSYDLFAILCSSATCERLGCLALLVVGFSPGWSWYCYPRAYADSILSCSFRIDSETLSIFCIFTSSLLARSRLCVRELACEMTSQLAWPQFYFRFLYMWSSVVLFIVIYIFLISI
jgi:hypothetical protein